MKEMLSNRWYHIMFNTSDYNPLWRENDCDYFRKVVSLRKPLELKDSSYIISIKHRRRPRRRILKYYKHIFYSI